MLLLRIGRMKQRKVSEDVALVANVMISKLINIDATSSALQVATKMSENKVSSVILTSKQKGSKE
jgi:signal-transduction protein with cAMP-binding, CBS, and nucleotidyltransferase domain